MSKFILIAAAISGVLAVMVGAFGAHALHELLESNQRLATFETASQYHFYHSIALLIIGYYLKRRPSDVLNCSAISMLVGIIVFSGSLYLLSITNQTILGAVAPIGGVLLIIGWGLLAFGIWKR
ncbi:MAG: DUF423 domain-containing protein [Bacteroidetes bacterium]|nr:DUF423 domain-containing protein [Bacteroidota bacterium]